MAQLFEKLKLKEYFDYTLEMDKDAFFENLGEMVDEGSASDLFSKQFDKFVDGDSYYVGYVSKGDFIIRRRYALFNNNSSIAIGKIKTADNQVSIRTEVTAFNHGNTYAPIVFFILYVVFSMVCYSKFEDSFVTFFRNISILFVLMLGFLFLMMRKAVADLRNELESDFDFIQIKNKGANLS